MLPSRYSLLDESLCTQFVTNSFLDLVASSAHIAVLKNQWFCSSNVWEKKWRGLQSHHVFLHCSSWLFYQLMGLDHAQWNCGGDWLLFSFLCSVHNSLIKFLIEVLFSVSQPTVLEMVYGGTHSTPQTPVNRQQDQQWNSTSSNRSNRVGSAGRDPVCNFCLLKNALPSSPSLLLMSIMSCLATHHQLLTSSSVTSDGISIGGLCKVVHQGRNTEKVIRFKKWEFSKFISSQKLIRGFRHGCNIV